MTHSHSAASAFTGLALIGRGAGLLPPRSGHPFIIDNQPQRIDGTERGARSWGMCRQFPAVADHLQDWPRKRAGSVTRRRLSRPAKVFLITGGGLGRPTFHHFNFIDQPRRQALADRSEFHFHAPSVCTPMLNTYRNARTTNWVTRTK